MADRDPDRTRVSLVDPNIGLVLAKRYRLELRLAAGGFGAVYHATDLQGGPEVAIKIMHAILASDPAVVARFRREGETLVHLRDRHTIRAYEIGELRDGRLFIVMELLHGESVYDRLHALGALPWRRAVSIARAICASLGEAHDAGIVHRDLKPANIYLEPQDGGTELVKVLDFGIAKVVDGAELTRVGQMIGTFDYMPPEQMLGGECTGRSDIFSLGVLLYEMITAAKPFGEAQSAAAQLYALLHNQPPSLGAHSDAPAELDRVVRRCLHHDPNLRFATMSELDRELARVADADDEDEATVSAPPPVQLGTTLPGVVPPSTRRSWPLLVPRKPPER